VVVEPPFELTDPLSVAAVWVTPEAGEVTTEGTLAVEKENTVPYVFTPIELVATAWK
jgi:hypothetical protein